MSTRRLVAGYGAFMAVATVLYFIWPSGSPVVVGLFGLLSATAVVVGVRRYRARRAMAWLMIAAALALNTAARALYGLLPGAPGTLKPWAWTVWTLHAMGLAFLLAGGIGLARSALRGVAAVIDSAVILLGLGITAAILLAIPYASIPDIGPLWAGARIGYVFRDVIILAIALFFLIALRRTASTILLVCGLAGLLAYDLTYRIGRVQGVVLTETPIDLGWMLFYIAIGAAALVPSMAVVGDARSTTGVEVTPIRLGPVAIAALLPSAVLLAASFRLPAWYQPLIIVVSTIVLALVFGRMVDVLLQLRRQIAGERALRDGIIDLAAATSTTDVAIAMDRAVRRLLGSDADYRLLLVPLTPDRRDLGTALDAEPHETGIRETGIRETATLPPAIAAQLGDRTPTLAIPLTQPTQPMPAEPAQLTSPTEPLTLLVQADRAALNAIRPRLDVLATEAALTLDRITLKGEVIRHTSEAYFRALVQNSADLILIVDDDDRIRYASPSAEATFGPAQLGGQRLLDLVDTSERAAAEHLLEHARYGSPHPKKAGSVESAYGDCAVHTADGAVAQMEVSCRDLRSEPSIAGLVVTMRDVTQQRQLEHELKQRAYFDPLTGLANRLAFSDRLEAAVRHASVAGGLVAALFIDLDDLKDINDGLGHDVGDALLSETGDRLRGYLAGQNVLPGMPARLGGDEFALLLAGIADQETADEVAARLVRDLSQPFQIGGHEVLCTASVGTATTAEEVASSAELLRHADLALYAAKGAGKAQWRRYEPWMQAAVRNRLELRSTLERALANDALFVEYQPIVMLDGGPPVGFEALLRWQHPTRGRLAPDEFIQVAEESGLITPIGEWVLSTAATALQRWTQAGPGEPPYIAVNVSARQFRSGDFVSTVRRALAKAGLSPRRLLLEITESLLLRDDESTWQDLDRLRKLGVRIAIDDFGTGYSALSYLRQVPLDVIKLDRLFIQNMTSSIQQRRLVEGIVNLAKGLGLAVVAEGIETQDQLALVKRAGCTLGQGYLFGTPMPEAEVRSWLTARRSVLA